MQEKNGITIRAKDLGVILTFAVIIVGSIVDSAITRAKVEEHDLKFKTYPPSVLYTNQANMADDLKEIKEDMKTLVSAFNDFMQSQ